MIDLHDYLTDSGTIDSSKIKKLTDPEKNWVVENTSYLLKSPSFGIRIKSLLFNTSNSHYSDPNYVYFKGNRILSRYQCQKNRLKGLLILFDENLSEKENMFNNGYRRIWDCGNKVYVWENQDV